MKNGFTLIEILVALVIVGILVGTAMVSFGAGIRSARMADATRAVQQYAGHARAIALLKQRPVVFTIEEISEEGVFVKSRITTTYGKDAEAESMGASGGAGFGVGTGGGVTTLSGIHVDSEDAQEAEENDPLSSEPRDFDGIHVRGILKEETEQRRSRISVFSTADLILRKNKEQQEKAREKREENGDFDSTKNRDDAVVQETDEETKFSVVYEPNGRCDPYTVKIWKDGTDEDRAISLEVSRFGKVIEEEER